MFIYVTSETYARVVRFEEENFFINPETNEKVAFPSINEQSSLLLSVIVPAYNEEQRCKSSCTL